ELGLDAISGRLDELHRAHGRLWLRDRPIDIVYRQFMIEDIADDEESAARLEPMLAAAEAGEIRVFTPLDSELYGSKGALALLSEAQADERLDSDVRAAVARLVPWTRIVLSGPTVLPDGTRGDLLEYAATHRAELVVKPSYGYGGNGLIAGWVP